LTAAKALSATEYWRLFKILPKQIWELPKLVLIAAVLGWRFIDRPYGIIAVWLCRVFYAILVYNNYRIIDA
jgi:hypothetical protein